MGDTVLKIEESDSIEPLMYVSTHKYLEDLRNRHQGLGVNQQVTRGILVTEALLFYHTEDFDDEIARTEERYRFRLSELYGDTIPEGLAKTKKVGRAETDLDEYALRERCDIDELTDNQIHIPVPISIKEQMSVRRGMGDYIREAVRAWYVSAFDSRLDRMECMRQLVEYSEQGTIPEHEVAFSIVNGDCEKFTLPDGELSELTAVLTGEDVEDDDEPHVRKELANKLDSFNGDIEELDVTDMMNHGEVLKNHPNLQKEALTIIHGNCPAASKGTFVSMLEKGVGLTSIQHIKSRIDKWADDQGLVHDEDEHQFVPVDAVGEGDDADADDSADIDEIISGYEGEYEEAVRILVERTVMSDSMVVDSYNDSLARMLSEKDAIDSKMGNYVKEWAEEQAEFGAPWSVSITGKIELES